MRWDRNLKLAVHKEDSTRLFRLFSAALSFIHQGLTVLIREIRVLNLWIGVLAFMVSLFMCVCVQKRSERVSCFGIVHVCASIAVERYDTAA